MVLKSLQMRCVLPSKHRLLEGTGPCKPSSVCIACHCTSVPHLIVHVAPHVVLLCITQDAFQAEGAVHAGVLQQVSVTCLQQECNSRGIARLQVVQCMPAAGFGVRHTPQCRHGAITGAAHSTTAKSCTDKCLALVTHNSYAAA